LENCVEHQPAIIKRGDEILKTSTTILSLPLVQSNDTLILSTLLAMGDALVENSTNAVFPHKKSAPADSIPNIDSLEGSGNDGGDEYSALKRYQRHLE
jgi:hypothetical protein